MTGLECVTHASPPFSASFAAQCAGHVVRVLIDSGCSTRCPLVAPQFIVRSGLPTEVSPPLQLQTVTNAFGPSIDRSCDLELTYDILINGTARKHSEDLYCYVHPTGTYDIILPYAWIQSILQKGGKWDSSGLHIPLRQGFGLLSVSDSLSQYNTIAQVQYSQKMFDFIVPFEDIHELQDDWENQVAYCGMVVATQMSGTDSHVHTLSEKKPPSFNVGIQDSMAHDFLYHHRGLFVEGLPPLPPHRPGFDVQLQLKPDAQPPKTYFKWPTAEESDFLRQKVNELLELGFIEPSTSQYGSHVLFVKKKDGSMRMVIDYRAINKILVDQATDLPPIQYLLSRVRNRAFLSSLDCASGYWQLRLADSASKEITSFICPPLGRFNWKVLPFGLKLAPGHFARSLTTILGDLVSSDEVFLYMDDILIATASLERHYEVLDMVFDRLRAHQFYLNAAKCVFFHQKLEWLGHLITPEGIRCTPAKVDAVRKLKPPETLKQLRSVLGLTGFYRRFCKDYAKVTAVLSNQLKQKILHWTPQAQMAFDQLKELVTSAPVLIVPDPSLPFLIQCDASDLALGAVLMQNPTG